MNSLMIVFKSFRSFGRWLTSILVALTASVLIWTAGGTAQVVQQNLDPGFGEGGKVVLETSKSFKFIRAIALQPNGKIVVAGYFSGKSGQQAFIGQLNADGTLNSNFGLSGFADVNFGSGVATGVAVQPDKKILVAGRSGSKFGLARFNKHGKPDLSFGESGVVTTAFFGSFDQAFAMALQQDGKIVLAGSARNGSHEQFALARYNSDGKLDATFGIDGKVIVDFSSDTSQALAVALQEDGKIIAAGSSGGGITTKNDFAIARLNQNGDLDSTFGLAGKVTTDLSAGSVDTAWDVIVQPDGRIVAVGEASSTCALARYNNDGSLDLSFGNAGIVISSFFGAASCAFATAIQSDGKIIAGGYASNAIFGDQGFDFALARYNRDGSPDLTFGTSGTSTIDFFGDADTGTCVALQSDGKIVVAGSARRSNFKYSLAVARL